MNTSALRVGGKKLGGVSHKALLKVDTTLLSDRSGTAHARAHKAARTARTLSRARTVEKALIPFRSAIKAQKDMIVLLKFSRS